MNVRVRKALAKRAQGDAGFTLVELLVVVIIIGILAAVAIPMFLNQKQKAFDASVKSDLKNAASSMETYYVDNNGYPDALANATLTVSDGNTFAVFTQATGPKSGFVVYGKNSNSEKIFVMSSYAGSKPTATTLSAMPTVVGAEGKVPSGVTPTRLT